LNSNCLAADPRRCFKNFENAQKNKKSEGHSDNKNDNVPKNISQINSDEFIYELYHILNCGCEIKQPMILAIVKAIFATAYGSLKNSGLQRGLNP